MNGTTIDELMAGYSPGEIKVTDVESNCDNVKREWYFVPHFKDKDGRWHGVNSRGEYSSALAGDGPWYEWQKPVYPVRLYPFVYKLLGEKRWRLGPFLVQAVDMEVFQELDALHPGVTDKSMWCRLLKNYPVDVEDEA